MVSSPLLLRISAVTTAVAVAVVGGYWALTQQPPPTAPADEAVLSTTTIHQPVRLEVYGDSITQGDAHDLSRGRFGPLTWLSYTGSQVSFVGGVATGGHMAREALEDAKVDVNADVIIAFLGTNRFNRNRLGRPGTASEEISREVGKEVADLRKLAQLTLGGADPQRFVVVAIGPSDFAHVDSARTWNREMQQAAEAEGWSFIDPWTELRVADTNRWVSKDLAMDAIHPDRAGAKLLGEAIAEEVIKIDAEADAAES